MWWMEVLPPAILMGGCIVVAGLANIGFQKLGNGGKLRRKVTNKYDWYLLERDRRLAVKEWKTKGLEALKANNSNE